MKIQPMRRKTSNLCLKRKLTQANLERLFLILLLEELLLEFYSCLWSYLCFLILKMIFLLSMGWEKYFGLVDPNVLNLMEIFIAKVVIGRLPRVGMNYLDNIQIAVLPMKEMRNQKNYYGCTYLTTIKMVEWLRFASFQKQIVILQ